MAEQWPKRYQASERKLQHLRRAGVQPCSHAVSGMVSMLAVLLFLIVAGSHIVWQPLALLLTTSIQTSDYSVDTLSVYLGCNAQALAMVLIPIGLAGLGGWIVGNLLQTGFTLRWPGTISSEPSYYTMPRRRADTLPRALLAVLLLSAVAASTLLLLRTICQWVLDGQYNLGQMAVICCQRSLSVLVPSVLAIVGIDWLWTRYSFLTASGMTETERRRELRDTEPSWLLRRRQNQRRRGGTR
jgi:flagellar biosynthesis protein FlhB